ncbi:hypothetical protein ACTU6U_07985 [Microbacterium sp. A196]|uniref:hypothetical protein n=1 Tax=unclassified Microbacterium TaxID=2609290 RepID=UPI003FD19AFF
MSLPELPANSPPPSRWARQVSRYEPHGLDVLEAHVLAWTGRADEIVKTPKWRVAWSIAPLLALLASIGGFAAVFGSPRDIAIGRTDAPDMGSIPWAMLSYGVAAFGVVLILIRWFVDGRRRNGSLLILLGLTIGFGVLGVLIAFQLAAEGGADTGLMMLPAYVMMALAVVVFVVIAVSPPQAPIVETQAIPIDELDEKAMRYVMQERNDAIDALAERRLLPDVDIKVLKARPLGRLHIKEDS